MSAKRWNAEPVEQLSPKIGRRTLHTETMTIAWITLAKGAHRSRCTSIPTSRSRP